MGRSLSEFDATENTAFAAGGAALTATAAVIAKAKAIKMFLGESLKVLIINMYHPFIGFINI